MQNAELIVVKQLPVIEEQLARIKSEIEKSVSSALSLACTEDTYKEIKKARASLNKEFTELENRRKIVKKAVLAPYEHFEAIYKDCVTNVFKPADRKLAQQIAVVEDELKEQKRKDVVLYFNEYVQSQGITFLDISRVGLNVTLSASAKSLKEKIKAFVDGVASDLGMIQTQPHSAEILVEYKCTLNASGAIATVLNRRKRMEEEQEQAMQALLEKERQELAEQKVDEIIEAEPVPESAPIATQIDPEDEPVALPSEPEAVTAPADTERVFAVSFRVTGTMDQLKRLKSFLAEGGYQYEQL